MSASASGSSALLGAELSTGDSESSTAAHPFDCAVCHRPGDCNGEPDNCDPTDPASHVHYDCMDAF